MYNPTLDRLINQRQMLDQQINNLQQYSVPPININNQFTQPNNNFDFNGRWVNNEQEARNISNNNLPLILFDKNNPVFYMKNLDGTFETYEFTKKEQPIPVNNDERLDKLENQLQMLINALNQPKEDKAIKKGVVKDEQSSIK